MVSWGSGLEYSKVILSVWAEGLTTNKFKVYRKWALTAATVWGGEFNLDETAVTLSFAPCLNKFKDASQKVV